MRFIKVVTGANGTILGSTIVASRAGEMIAELALAIQHGLTLAELAATIHAYPTWSTSMQQLAADAAVEEFLASTSGKVGLGLARWLGRVVRAHQKHTSERDGGERSGDEQDAIHLPAGGERRADGNSKELPRTEKQVEGRAPPRASCRVAP